MPDGDGELHGATPLTPDTDKRTAMKQDNISVAEDTRNKAPVFADQDTETDGVQNTETTRKVEENAEAADDATDDDSADNVGSPVTATDPDPNADPLTYTLGGTDASKFTVKGHRSDRGGSRDEAGLRDQDGQLHGHGHG